MVLPQILLLCTPAMQILYSYTALNYKLGELCCAWESRSNICKVNTNVYTLRWWHAALHYFQIFSRTCRFVYITTLEKYIQEIRSWMRRNFLKLNDEKNTVSSCWIASAIIKSFSSIYYNWWLADNPLITSTKFGCYNWLDNDSKTSYLQHRLHIIILYQKYWPNKEILESKCCWTNYTCICHITAQ